MSVEVDTNRADIPGATTEFKYGDVSYVVPAMFDKDRLSEYVDELPVPLEDVRELSVRMMTGVPYNQWLAASVFVDLPRSYERSAFDYRFKLAKELLVAEGIAIRNGASSRAARIAIVTSGLVKVGLIEEDAAREIEAVTGVPRPGVDSPRHSKKIRRVIAAIDTEAINASTWTQAAACQEIEEDIFFSGSEEDIDAAKAVCDTCDVREYCLGEALLGRIMYGVWGGTDEKERRQILAREQRRKIQ